MIQPKYERAMPFDNKLALVKLNEKVGFIDRKGIEVVPIIYDDGRVGFSDSLAVMKMGGKWGTVDMSGRL